MKIAVFCGNPKPSSFGAALSAAYVAGARESGHQTRLFDLAKMTFDPILRSGFDEQPLEPDLVEAKEAILWAEHLVLVWPLWIGMPPALMKGFLERTLSHRGFALEFLDQPPYYKPLLGGRSARQIVTMQMPALVYRFLAGARAVKAMEQNVLGFVGLKPVRRTLLGGVDNAGDEKRRAMLENVELLGRRAA